MGKEIPTSYNILVTIDLLVYKTVSEATQT